MTNQLPKLKNRRADKLLLLFNCERLLIANAYFSYLGTVAKKFNRKIEKSLRILSDATTREIFKNLFLETLRVFLFLKIKIMKENTTKSDLLKAFDQSESKTIADACRIVGITPSTFHFHQGKDSVFRRQIMQKRLEYLTEKINGGKNNE